MNIVARSNNLIEVFLQNFHSQNTKQSYLKDLKDFFSFANIAGPEQLTFPLFVSYRDHLMSKNLAPKTVQRKLSSLKSLMKFLKSQNVISNNPIDSVKLPNPDPVKPTQAFTDDEVREVLANAESSRDRLVMSFLFYMGLRRSELTGICIKDIYTSNGTLVLRVRGKGSKIREVPFNAKLKELYEEYIVESDLQDANDKLFNITTKTVYRIVKKYSNGRLSPHSCRATVISHLLENGESIRNVADFAGHVNTNTTQLYDKKRDNITNSSALKVAY